MKIKAIKHGAFEKLRGATNSTRCWDDEDTAEIDLGLLQFRLNAVLSKEKIDVIMPQIENFFFEFLNKR
jgi:hypothetical protein